jgi:transposase
MLNQEDYVKVLDLHRQGWSNKEIAAELGYHPATIAKYLRGGPPTSRVVPDEDRVMTSRWRQRIGQLLDAHPRLLAVSVFNKIRAEGYAGSYPTVVRAVRAVRGPRFRAASAVSVPIFTDPGEEAQFDFCDLSDWAARWGWMSPLFCFGAILCWSRHRLWWFTTSQDRHHTFEGLVRLFEQVGGVPAVCRTDRMGALGTSQGTRFQLHPPTVAFGAHHGTKITSCRAGDAKRKGKVERPFRQLQETFLPEVELDGVPASVEELNVRAAAWLTERVHAVASRTTAEPPVMRLEVERPFLSALPRVRFDTDYVETRRVHTSFPFVVIDNIRYSVPAKLLGQLVEIRRRVEADRFEIRWAGQTIATHPVVVGGPETVVWDPTHRAEAETEALTRTPQRHLRVIEHAEPTLQQRLQLAGDLDVDTPDLRERYRFGALDDQETGA